MGPPRRAGGRGAAGPRHAGLSLDKGIHELRQRLGEGTAEHAKVILSGLPGLPLVMTRSTPTRSASRPRRGAGAPSGVPCSRLAASADAVGYDLVDLTDVLSGLGCRIGDVLALDRARIDDAARTTAIGGTVVRMPGQGLIVQPHTKSEAGTRTITPPPWVIALLRRRHADSHGPWVSPSTRGTLGDPDNTRKQLRQTVADSDWQGLHPHAFRHLVATRPDVAGLRAREIADYLGHGRVSMTLAPPENVG